MLFLPGLSPFSLKCVCVYVCVYLNIDLFSPDLSLELLQHSDVILGQHRYCLNYYYRAQERHQRFMPRPWGEVLICERVLISTQLNEMK